MYFTEPHKLYFYDVRESFFDAYRDVMNPFFKDPNGKIMTYTEVKKRAVYHRPFYTREDTERIGDEARKFVMYSETDWTKADKLVRNMGRVSVQVNICLFSSKNIPNV